LAWRLWKMDGLGDFDIFPFVERAAAFLVRYAPVTQQERWEEAAGYSPSTLAAVISALVCAADIARSRQASELGSYLETYADWIEAHLDEWTTTTEGVLLPEVKYHYMRIRPPAEGEPFYNPQLPPGWIHINNREPGEKADFEAREVIDAGFLELVRYGIRRADDPLINDSLKVVDHCLKIETPFGDCWRRYNHDGYGQKKNGDAYNGSGQGRAWPILTGERGHYELCAGHDYSSFIKAIEQFSSTGGMLPEQIWDYSDIPSKGMYLGRPAGSAQPLVWAHAEYLKLLRSAADKRVFDRISVVEARYGVEAGERTFTNHIEIFEVTRPVRTIFSGYTLRIVDREHFRVVYTFDNWATTGSVEARSVGYPGSFVDISAPDQAGTIQFTLAWSGEGQQERWLGRNIDVSVISPPESTNK
jgi:glucoamylase